MRELKFRVWDKIKKRMIVFEQDFMPLNVTNWGVLRLAPNHEEDLYEFVKPVDGSEWKIMQFAGFKDKNGKELYEGDIVREWIKDNVLEDGGYWWYAKVEKMNGAYLLLQIDFDYDKSNCVFPEDFSFVYEYAKDCEIIGNIYENPELLKSTK